MVNRKIRSVYSCNYALSIKVIKSTPLVFPFYISPDVELWKIRNKWNTKTPPRPNIFHHEWN